MLLAMLGFAVTINNVSLEIPALPVPKLVAEIAKITGKPLYASPDLDVDIVCIRAKDVSLDDLKSRLANTIGAQWEIRENREILVRPPGLAKAQEAEEHTARAKEIAELIANRPALPEFGEGQAGAIVAKSKLAIDRMDENFVTEEHDKARRELWAATELAPPRRMLERIIKTLDPSLLARIEVGQQLILSDRPTRMQKPLNSSLIAEIKRIFEKEQQTFRRVIDRSGPLSYDKADDNRYVAWETEPEVYKVLVRVDLSRSTGLPLFSIKLANSEGKVRGTSFLTLSRSAAKPVQPLSWDGEFILDPASVTWNNLFWKMVGIDEIDHDSKLPMDAFLKPYLEPHANPEQHEPLSFSAGRAFLKFAESQDKNLVALIPDRAMVWYEATTAKQGCQAFANFAANRWGGKFSRDDYWIQYRPIYLAEGRRDRLNRSDLGHYFRKTRDEKALLIDPSAGYAFATKSPLLFEGYDRTVATYVERMQGDYAPRDTPSIWNRSILKFLGALSANQRQTLLGGGSISRSQLTSQSISALEKFVYGESIIGRGFFGKIIYGYEKNREEILGDLAEEATESLKNGIPSSTRISGEVSQVPMIIHRYADNGFYSTSYSPEGLGSRLAFDESTNSTSKYEYALGSARLIRIRFDFGNGLSTTSELSEINPGTRTKYRSWHEFPAEISKQIEATMAKEREVLARRKERMKTSAPPP